jgi:isoleucyl-tRNA synthetase
MGASASARRYPEVEKSPSFPALEERVLARWQAEGLFQTSVERNPRGERGANEYVFYDGPPFANGLPHYGHLLTGFIKDVVPRFHTMRGRRVERRFGWDCHGLPAEMEAEKELGLHGRAAIQAHGIERFNAHCRTSVMRYVGEWQRLVTRQARWVDFQRDYKTMDRAYMESVLWAFQALYRKGLVYRGYRVMPYSWAAETPVSNFETRLDNSYRMRQDPALTVAFRLDPAPGEEHPLDALAWTTTPWTLPSNLALAVGPDLEYVRFRKDGRERLLAAAAAARYEHELAGWERAGVQRGRELVGRRYQPLFPFFAGRPGAFRILAGDFVTTEDGTGIVHMAPGFGEDDQRVCEANGIELVCPVDDAGRFTAEVASFAGQNVLEANKPIAQELKSRGALVRQETVDHNYPHCWRTDEPLIYRAVSSWYVEVTRFRERMVELNRSIRWIPASVGEGQFGKWLEGARDWSISRNRFWGSPIPVWESDDPRHPRLDVYGSIAELERDFGVEVRDLHRPFVDRLVRPNPDDPSGKSTMRRVPEVLDCWFESGSMPFAQVHYPFESRQWFDEHFPADFITEYVAQTRGWFYTLVVLATALFDKPPFENVICHGVVLDERGRKLSKRLKNYPSPDEVFASHGADALRWFLLSSPIVRGADLQIDREGRAIGEVVRLVLLPLWNAYAFFALYANADGVRAGRRTDAAGTLDRYVLSKAGALVEDVTRALDDYDLAAACAGIRAFLDALNNWYIRRSRERFWRAGADADKQEAYDTLFTVLETLSRLAAPLLPMVSDEIWRGLTGERSVHLAAWPGAAEFPRDGALVSAMDRVREVCSAALALRESERRRVRLPLAELAVAAPWARNLEPHAALIADELNVKHVRLTPDVGGLAGFELKLNAKTLGPRLGKDMQRVLAAAKAGRWSRAADGTVSVDGAALAPGDCELRVVPRPDAAGLALAALPSGDGVVALDVRVTPELEREGLARDLVRAIQQARKDAGLDVSDRITLALEVSGALREAADAHRDWIAGQVLAASVALDGRVDGGREVEIDAQRVRIGLARA